MHMTTDQRTASAFANSWNNLPLGSIYTREQFEDWMLPLTAADVYGKRVLELGCGNGSQLVHMAAWSPAFLEGVDLGESVLSARKNLSNAMSVNWKITKWDMIRFNGPGYDLVYSIGVLHHLNDPKKGFEAVIRNVKDGGRFHCWVYAEEGNSLVINLVDPLRRIASRLPWWIVKYFLAAPLAVPFYLYAKLLRKLDFDCWAKILPLYEYSLWISRRGFNFFRHVVFDQLVTPQTCYINKNTIMSWIGGNDRIDGDSVYIKMRNGNSWKFGGKIKNS